MADREPHTLRTTPRAFRGWDPEVRRWAYWEVKSCTGSDGEEGYLVSKIIEKEGEPHCALCFGLAREEALELADRFHDLTARP